MNPDLVRIQCGCEIVNEYAIPFDSRDYFAQAVATTLKNKISNSSSRCKFLVQDAARIWTSNSWNCNFFLYASEALCTRNSYNFKEI